MRSEDKVKKCRGSSGKGRKKQCGVTRSCLNTSNRSEDRVFSKAQSWLWRTGRPRRWPPARRADAAQPFKYGYNKERTGGLFLSSARTGPRE